MKLHYGYRGDWDLETLELILPDGPLREAPVAAIAEAVRSRRNVVLEMVATLRAVKPIRPALAEQRKPAAVRYLFQMAPPA